MKNLSELLQELKCLSCERLSSDIANLRLVEQFYNRRNDCIAQTLRNEAFEEDEQGDTAYYVVKHSSGEIMFFFSLKTGMLYDQFLDTRQLKLIKEFNLYLDNMIQNETLNDSNRNLIVKLREKLRTRKGITKADLESISNLGSTIFDDMEKEFNESTTRVGQTFPAVELVHFCTNDGTESLWKQMGIPMPFGALVFWYFAVPIVQRIREHVGCRYLFLFAADLTKNEKLVKYYADQLNFQIPENLATAKPIYDFSCKFMCQEINGLLKGREDFFNHSSDYDLEI